MSDLIKAAHTQAPFEPGFLFTNDGDKPLMAMVNGERTRIALVCSVMPRTRKTKLDAPDAERDANIALFVASPKLLQAAKKTLAFLDDLSKSNPGFMAKLALQDYEQWQQAITELSAAVSLAEGGGK